MEYILYYRLPRNTKYKDIMLTVKLVANGLFIMWNIEGYNYLLKRSPQYEDEWGNWCNYNELTSQAVEKARNYYQPHRRIRNIPNKRYSPNSVH